MNRNSIFCDNKSDINDSESSLNRQIFNFVYHFELQAYYNIKSIFASCNSIFTLSLVCGIVYLRLNIYSYI